MSADKSAWSHPTANIEEDVQLGDKTKVWDNVHIRRGAQIGHSCIVGEKSYIAYDVKIGNFVKINASVYICAGVTIDDFCMISAHTVFTNDKFPRAGNAELTALETSAATEQTLSTTVEKGVTIGANATIGPGVTLQEFSMVGMGSVVTRSVAPHALVTGNPAKQVAWVCSCGPVLARFGEGPLESVNCERCGRNYRLDVNGLQLTGEMQPK